MTKKLTIGLFVALILVQIYVPLSMIIKREVALNSGTTFRFKTAPVDPYDAFRGRYVALRLEADKGNKQPDADFKHRQKVYAEIAVDDQGFAKISHVTLQKPKNSVYLTAKVDSVAGNEVYVTLPMDRYYMEEKAAPLAEQVYRQNTGRANHNTYIRVRIRDGFGVIEGLYIGDKRIEDMVRNEK